MFWHVYCPNILIEKKHSCWGACFKKKKKKDLNRPLRKIQCLGYWERRPGYQWIFFFLIEKYSIYYLGFPGGSDYKECACSAADLGSIPGWGRSPGERTVYQLQYSYLENSMDRRAWQATVHGVAKRQTKLSN